MRQIGAPVVIPLKIPERISTLSASALVVTAILFPGLLLSRSLWISSSVMARPAGHPSMMAPTHLPWLSPKLVMVKSLPRLFAIYLHLAADAS